MPNLQEVFNNIQKSKKEQREIKSSYRNALTNLHEYQELTEKLKTMRERRKQIENTVKEEFGSEFNRFETLQLDIDTNNQMLSDLALTKLIKGENIDIIDEKDNKYEPQFNVKFKKV